MTDEQKKEIKRLESLGYLSGYEPAPPQIGVTIFDKDKTYNGLNLYVSGHSSEPRALKDNALHKLSSWVARAVTAAGQMELEDRRPCFNVGEIHGGIKSNVIADQARLHWSARLSPGDSNEDFLKLMTGLDSSESGTWKVPFSGPPLPTDGQDSSPAQAFVDRHGIESGPMVNFWTEASLFAQAGIPACVLGPGNIAQAHVVDEWVSLDQLERALDIYRNLVESND